MHFPDHRTSSPLGQAITRPPPSRTGAWLLACTLGLVLTACGGSSSDDIDSSSGAGAGGAGGTTPSQSGVFIAASGPLCAQRSSPAGHCIQPTSSAITAADLVKTLIDPDPQKPLVQFDSMGFIMNRIYSFSQQPGAAYQGSITTSSYGLARYPVQVGRNTFTVQDRHYPLATSYPQAGQINYKAEQDKGSLIFDIGTPQAHQEDGWRTSFSEEQTLSRTGTMPNTRHESRSWISALRLLTDQTDAPGEQTVTYIGTLSPLSGTGEPVDAHTSNTLSTGVHYEAEFNTRTGWLTGVKVDYTDPESQRHTVLEIPALQFVNSQLVPASRGQRVRVQLAGPGEDARQGAPLPDTARLQMDFQLEGLEGEITGKQATFIEIVGGGPQGFMQLVLVRKDRMGSEIPSYIPLQR